MKPTPSPLTSRVALRDLGRALQYVKPVRGLYLQKLFYMTFSVVPTLILPWPGKVLVDHVIRNQPLEVSEYPFFFQPFVESLMGASPSEVAIRVILFSLVLLVVFGGFASDRRDSATANLAQGSDTATTSENSANHGHSFMGGILGWFEYRVTLQISQTLNHHYRSQLFERIQRLPMARLDDQRIGDAIYRLMYDTPQITEVCERIILTPIVAPIQVAGLVWVMMLSFGEDPFVAWMAAAVVPIVFFASLPFAPAVRRLGMRSRESGAETTTTIEEGMSNVLAVQGLGGSAHQSATFERNSWRSFTEFRRFIVVWIGIVTVIGAAGALVFILVFYRLTDAVFAGALSVGDLWVIMAYYGALVGVALNVGLLWIYLQDNAVGLRRVFELMDEPTDHQPADAVVIDDIREGYRFEDVSYVYPDGTRALDGVSFEARRGQLLAFVGPAGAGKTSLAYMLPRFLRPTSGQIAVDGVPLDDIDRDALREQVAFVFQEPVLFDASVAENIRMGRLDATDEEVMEAAQQAGAAGFIEALPEGYATRLGRGGGRLSVGQKQRLSIARALVRRAPVLILDEPTAALDPETEMHLVTALHEASRDRLVVVIAHRLSTIRGADQILFLDAGRVLERGSHAGLMAREGGAYRRFVELQRSGAAA